MSADTYFYMGSADTAEDTDPCMRHYTLGKDYGARSATTPRRQREGEGGEGRKRRAPVGATV